MDGTISDTPPMSPEDFLQIDVEKIENIEDIRLMFGLLQMSVHKQHVDLASFLHLCADDDVRRYKAFWN